MGYLKVVLGTLWSMRWIFLALPAAGLAAVLFDHEHVWVGWGFSILAGVFGYTAVYTAWTDGGNLRIHDVLYTHAWKHAEEIRNRHFVGDIRAVRGRT